MTIEGRSAPAIVLPAGVPEALLHIAVAVAAVIVSVSSFALSLTFGIGATFALTLAIATAMPAGVPVLVIVAFLVQNMVIAWYTPMVPDNEVFDSLRGMNFVMLMSAFGAFFLAAFQPRMLAVAPLRRWIAVGIVVGAIVAVYLALGVARGVPKDAIVYFRNIVTPIACFFVALMAAMIWRVDLLRPVSWIAAFAILYGYLELTFTMDFLALFHGDEYILRNISNQIQSGYWEKALQQTGFVFRGLEDVMLRNAFNLPMLSELLPKVFRINGPNFHTISYAYALSIASIWLLFNGRWVLPALALPLILVIGSKGALVLLFLAVGGRVAAHLMGGRIAVILVALGAVLWIAASIVVGMGSGDYHVLGLFAGLREFASNPVGQGLGFGGNLSSASLEINWELAQAEGAAGIPMESAFSVLIYQMGVASIALYGFIAAIAWSAWRSYRWGGNPNLLFVVFTTIVISANSVLQEEAFFSPLALGFLLLLGGVAIGDAARTERAPGVAGKAAQPSRAAALRALTRR